MTRKIIKRYSKHDSWLLGSLPKSALTPFAVLLLGALLFTNIIAATHACSHSEHSSQTDLYALDGGQELSSEPFESSELRTGREGLERPSTLKVKVRSALRLVEHTPLNTPDESRYTTDLPFLPLASPHKSPVTPRPPPASPVQA